ncbi:efflux RND transporter permease subunit, partial [Campylobacter coli]
HLFTCLDIARKIISENKSGTNILSYILYTMNNQIIKKQIKKKRSDGVGKIEAKGFLEPQIRIELKPNELRKYNLNALDVANIIKSQ